MNSPIQSHVQTSSKLKLAFLAAFSLMTSYLVYRFYVEGMVWTGPLGGLFLTLGLLCSQARTVVQQQRWKRTLVFLSWQEELVGHADLNSRLREFNLRFGGSSRNVMKISASPATLALTGSERDRTSSGEVEADKLADPAHASLSE